MMVVVLGEGRRKGGDGVSKEGVFDRETEGKAREVDGEVKPQRGERGRREREGRKSEMATGMIKDQQSSNFALVL